MYKCKWPFQCSQSFVANLVYIYLITNKMINSFTFVIPNVLVYRLRDSQIHRFSDWQIRKLSDSETYESVPLRRHQNKKSYFILFYFMCFSFSFTHFGSHFFVSVNALCQSHVQMSKCFLFKKNSFVCESNKFDIYFRNCLLWNSK